MDALSSPESGPTAPFSKPYKLQPSPLLQLPAEIRETIFRYAVTFQEQPIRVFDAAGQLRPQPASLRTCRQTREESRNHYLFENAFMLTIRDHDTGPACRWLLATGSDSCSLVPLLIFELDTEDAYSIRIAHKLDSYITLIVILGEIDVRPEAVVFEHSDALKGQLIMTARARSTSSAFKNRCAESLTRAWKVFMQQLAYYDEYGWYQVKKRDFKERLEAMKAQREVKALEVVPQEALPEWSLDD